MFTRASKKRDCKSQQRVLLGLKKLRCGIHILDQSPESWHVLPAARFPEEIVVIGTRGRRKG